MKRDEWLCGYAAGLAAVHRATRDSSGIAWAMVSDGVTLKRLREAGAETFDTDELARALQVDSAASVSARGGN